jgi:hypothetical protein
MRLRAFRQACRYITTPSGPLFTGSETITNRLRPQAPYSCANPQDVISVGESVALRNLVHRAVRIKWLVAPQS